MNQTLITQDFMIKTRVQQMQNGMFYTTNVMIHW
jgi:hypothetical protein